MNNIGSSNSFKNLKKFEDIIKQKGLRITQSRKAILNTVFETRGIYNIEDFHKLIRNKYPYIGIATTYRSMKLIEEIGLIEKKGIINNKTIYGLTEEKKNSTPVSNSLLQNGLLADNPVPDNLMQSDNVRVKDNYLQGNYTDLKDLNKIGKQLTGWLNDVNKLKKQKELEMEEIIMDLANIDCIIENHDRQKGDLIQILLDIQGDYRWLPKHVLFYVSKKLDVPLPHVYSIASFYKFFNLEPRGENTILVCMGTACHVRGAMNLLQRIVNTLGVKPGDTTTDLKFTLDTVNCLGACALGPVMMVGGKYYSNPSTGKLKKILNNF